MKWIDVHVHSNLSNGVDGVNEIVEKAKKYGLKAVSLADVTNDNYRGVEEIRMKVEKEVTNKDFELYLTADLRVDKVYLAKKLSLRVRKHVDFLTLSTQDLLVARWAAKSFTVDAISRPFNYPRLIIDKATCRFMLQGETALEVRLNDITRTSGRRKAVSIRTLTKEIEIAKHYGVPVILSTNAKEAIELKTPFQVISIAHLLGLETGYSKIAFSNVPYSFIMRNRKFRSDERGEG